MVDMLIEAVLVSLLGVGLGSALGLLPGMHINNILPLILSMSFLFSSPLVLTVFIVSIAVSQILTSYIPSIFLGAPEEGTALCVLPGHRLLFEGRGYEAIKLSIIGSLGSLVATLAIIAIFSSTFAYIYDLSRPYIHYLISLVALMMIFSEKKLKKILSAVLVFALSGIFGIFVLNSSILTKQHSLFPVLSGLFGLCLLIISMSEESKIPPQTDDNEMKIRKKEIIKSIFLGSIAGILVGMLPAIGVSQAATMVQYLGSTGEARSFLMTVSGINVANEVFSLVSLYLVGNPRSGASVAIQQILGGLNTNQVIFLIGFICFSTGLASYLTLFLGKKIPKYLEKVNYKQLTLVIILFVVSLVTALTGFSGLLILFTAVSIGLLCNYLNIRKSHCMGVLLLPSILFFAGLNPIISEILGI